MNKSKNNRTTYMIILLVGLLIIAVKTIFPSDSEDLTSSDSGDLVSVKIEQTLQQINSINFDTKVVNDPKILTLKSIEIPLVSRLVGRKNPFSSIFGTK